MGINFRKTEKWLRTTNLIVGTNTGVAITFLGSVSVTDAIPAGTKALFNNSSSPVGWLRISSDVININNSLVSGTISSPGVAGSTNPLTHTHSAGHTHRLQDHSHTINNQHYHAFSWALVYTTNPSGTPNVAYVSTNSSNTLTIGTGQGSTTHQVQDASTTSSNHDPTLPARDIKYSHVILCEKQ